MKTPERTEFPQEPVDLRSERLRLGNKLGETAEAIGVPRHVLMRAERPEKHNPPSAPNAYLIAKFYGLDPVVQWHGQESAEPAVDGAAA